MKQQISIASNESGSALVIALLIMIFLTLVGIVTFIESDYEDDNSSDNMHNLQAIYIAEAGIEMAKNELQIVELSKILQNNGALRFGGPVNFEDGSYSVAVLDNDDGDNDRTTDQDNTVLIVSTGRTAAGVEKTIEVTVKINKYFPTENIPAAVNLVGDADLRVKGASFRINAEEIGETFVPKHGIAVTSHKLKREFLDNFNDRRKGEIEGADLAPSIEVDSLNPFFSTDFISDLSAKIASIADTTFTSDVVLDGMVLGSSESPAIIAAYAQGHSVEISLKDQFDIYGILVTKGGLEITGTGRIQGIILVIGDAGLKIHSDSISINGAIFVSSERSDSKSRFDIQGEIKIRYDSKVLSNINKKLTNGLAY